MRVGYWVTMKPAAVSLDRKAHRRNRSEPISPEHLARLAYRRSTDGGGSSNGVLPHGHAPRQHRLAPLRLELPPFARLSKVPEWNQRSARLLACMLGALALLACGVAVPSYHPDAAAATVAALAAEAPAAGASPRLKRPVLLHQTLPTLALTPQMIEWRQSWERLGFLPRLADNDGCREDMRVLVEATGNSDYLSVYDNLELGVQRSDMWRYAALYLYGGVYADIDVVAEPQI